MVSELLNKGKENAITTKELMEKCNFPSNRELTAQVSRERAAGVLICSKTSGHGGYYLPKNREEIVEFINSMSSRAKNIFSTLKYAKEYLNQIDGQITMDMDLTDE